MPWAWSGEFSCLVLHVSALAGHTQAMELHPSSQETQTELRSVLKRLELDELGRAIEEAIRTQDMERFKTLDARRTALRMH